MTDHKIRDRVRKLLAMAADEGASENEKAFALKRAEAMIEEHNIQIGEGWDESSTIEVIKGEYFVRGMQAKYHILVGSSIAMLYDCLHVNNKPLGAHQFWGMSHQVEAAEETFLWIVAQIDDLYRVALKAFSGQLTKSQRAELRASFKDGAATRVNHRICEILEKRSDSRDSRALVVVDAAAAVLEEMSKDLKSIVPTVRSGFGTEAGYRAGDQVRIQKEVEA